MKRHARASRAIEQTVFPDVLEHDRAEQRAALHRYAERWRTTYRAYAAAIAPDLRNAADVWDRFAFAILSANTNTHLAHRALTYVGGKPSSIGRKPSDESVRLAGITPDRLRYVSALPYGDDIFTLLIRPDESWRDYRSRLVDGVEGLAITKAGYAVSLLYPTTADVACIDVWMQRLLIGPTITFRDLDTAAYRACEQTVRTFGQCHGVSTALAQWIMWDFIRTGSPTPQRFFDG